MCRSLLGVIFILCISVSSLKLFKWYHIKYDSRLLFIKSSQVFICQTCSSIFSSFQLCFSLVILNCVCVKLTFYQQALPVFVVIGIIVNFVTSVGDFSFELEIGTIEVRQRNRVSAVSTQDLSTRNYSVMFERVIWHQVWLGKPISKVLSIEEQGFLSN